MNEFRYVVSLRAGHPTMPADAIRSVVGLPSEFMQTAGQAFTTRSGKKTSRINKRSWIIFRLPVSGDDDLASTLDRWSDYLTGRTDGLLRLRREGVDFDFFVGLFLEGNSGVELPPPLLQKMAALGITLGLDIYPPDEKSAATASC
jgi:hypothetical protein